MKHKKIYLWLVTLFCIFSLCANQLQLDSRLPIDENVTIGHLENGLTYYIRQNSTPLNFAELRLVLSVGSSMEDDDQRGMAHFVEHSAFNGTESFPGDSLRTYQSSIGLGLGGGGLNAMTSIEFTSYVLPSRTDNKEELDTAFLVLSEWASKVTLDHEAIDRERLIVMEEWRMSQSGRGRMMDKRNEVLYAGSLYAQRMPIGTAEVIENIPYQRIKDFYNDWYRPDLMAVIAVGDFEIEEIRTLIYKHFNDIPTRENPREKHEILIPFHEETLIAIGNDPEVTDVNFEIMYKLPRLDIETMADYRDNLILRLINTMMNNRFTEISRNPDSPITEAWSYGGQNLSNIRSNFVAADLDEDQIIEGIITIITEIERVKQHAFYQSELNRAKDMLTVGFERAYLGRETIQSRALIWRYQGHFLYNSPALSEQFEHEIANIILDSITLEDIANSLIRSENTELSSSIFADQNRSVLLFAPESVKDQMPTEEYILSLFETIANTELELYPEMVLEEELMASIPRSIRIRRPKYNRQLDMWTWTLRNGARVHLKQTDFRNNEILFRATRTGGNLLIDDELFLSALYSEHIMAESGIGPFNRNMLERYLSGKDLSFNVSIGNWVENINGRSSINDLETGMKLLWLQFNELRYDEDAFETWRRKGELTIRNELNDPQMAHSAKTINVLFNDHPRSRGIFMTHDDLMSIDHKTAFDFYQSRFDSANGFDFIFVGDINKDDLHRYIAAYIATLPSQRVDTRIIDRNLRFNQTSTIENIYLGSQQSIVRLAFSSDFTQSFEENQKYRATVGLLSLLLHEYVREQIGGVYYITAIPFVTTKPHSELSTNIHLFCDPERVEEIIEEILNVIATMKNNTFEDRYLESYKETTRQRRINDSRTNNFWLTNINDMFLEGYSPEQILGAQKLIDNLTREDIAEIANKYIDFDKQLRIILFPEIHE
ncbi:MAG: insulinase family protein [Candidatus Cloacimonetes bacterium]|nr:insulinase family protein [Candidatus Cloacimonadota bacterium]